MIVLDLAQTTLRNMKIENEGLFKKCLHYTIAWEMLTTNRLKTSQCTMDGDFVINKIT